MNGRRSLVYKVAIKFSICLACRAARRSLNVPIRIPSLLPVLISDESTCLRSIYDEILIFSMSPEMQVAEY